MNLKKLSNLSFQDTVDFSEKLISTRGEIEEKKEIIPKVGKDEFEFVFEKKALEIAEGSRLAISMIIDFLDGEFVSMSDIKLHDRKLIGFQYSRSVSEVSPKKKRHSSIIRRIKQRKTDASEKSIRYVKDSIMFIFEMPLHEDPEIKIDRCMEIEVVNGELESIEINHNKTRRGFYYANPYLQIDLKTSCVRSSNICADIDEAEDLMTCLEVITKFPEWFLAVAETMKQSKKSPTDFSKQFKKLTNM